MSQLSKRWILLQPIVCFLILTSLTTRISNAANEPTRGYLQYVAKQLTGLDNNTSYFPQAFWDSLTLEAVSLTAELCGYPTDTASIPTVAGTIEYALDSNFANPIYIYSLKRKKALKQIPAEELGLHKGSDTLDAEFYYIRGGRRYGGSKGDSLSRPTIGLLFANRVDTIKVAFFRQPRRDTLSTSIVDIPREFAVAIPHFIASWALERNKLYQEALYHYQKALAIIDEVKARKRITPAESFAPKVK